VYRKLRAGFTLIELIVVISIILILAAMLLPVLERTVKSAEATSCLANVRNLALASQLYDAQLRYQPRPYDDRRLSGGVPAINPDTATLQDHTVF